MGLQLYITKAALEKRDIAYTETSELLHLGCRCGDVTVIGRYCDHCASMVSTDYGDFADVTGIAFRMCSDDTHVYHDANKWGRFREPLDTFVKLHKMTKDEWHLC
jgi:hypothetical protein